MAAHAGSTLKVAEALPSHPGLIVAPNPLRGRGLLVASLSQAGPARVSLFDIGGNKIWAQGLPSDQPGVQRLDLDLSAKASGIFFAVLEQDQGFGYKALATFKVALAH